MPPDGLSCQAGCTRVGRAGPQQNQLHTGCNLHSAKSQEEGHWKYQFVLGGAGAGHHGHRLEGYPKGERPTSNELYGTCA